MHNVNRLAVTVELSIIMLVYTNSSLVPSLEAI